jgi:tRNA uridine 5-carbamoylmethylation protein Kti12
MANCYILVGLPASGKSTRVEQLLNMYPDAFVYSTDNYIEECAQLNGWTYNKAFSTFIKPATKAMNEQLEIAIRANQTVIWDQTNLSKNKRSKIVDKMRQKGYRTQCECFLIPETVEDIAEWNNRLHSRPGKTIPDNIIASMVKNYEIPSTSEEFDGITFFNISGEVVHV